MNAARFIARKLRFEGKMAMVSIAVSFLVIILAVTISGGFRREIRSGISAVAGDVQITWPEVNAAAADHPLDLSAPCLSGLDSLPGVASVRPAVYRGGIVKGEKEISGVLFKGAADSGLDSLRVRIPASLARQTGLAPGDRMTAYFVGEKVRARRFLVDGIYEGVLSGSDNLVVLAGLEDLQRLCQWEAGEVSAVELVLSPQARDRMDEIAETVGDRILFRMDGDASAPMAISAQQRFPQIFSWLDLIDFNVAIILLLMVVVAGFNMISGLLILLFRNISTIGTLKALGMTDRAISEVFLRVSSRLVLLGMAIGNALALLFCLIQGTTHLIRLNPENYFLSFVPVEVNPLTILGADALAYAAIMVLLLIPSLFIARVDPARTVRVE